MFLVLWLFFVLINGKLTVEIALFGFAAAGLALLVSRRLFGWSIDSEKRFLRRLPTIAVYGLWLFGEIFKANLDTLRRVWSPKRVKPSISTVVPRVSERWQLSLMANSITLTPGTFSISCDSEKIVVHCLDEGFSVALESSEIKKRIERMEAVR